MKKTRKVMDGEQKQTRAQLYEPRRSASGEVIRASQTLSWRFRKENGMGSRNGPLTP